MDDLPMRAGSADRRSQQGDRRGHGRGVRRRGRRRRARRPRYRRPGIRREAHRGQRRPGDSPCAPTSTDAESMRNLVDRALARYGRLDAAFNNATDGPMPAPLADIDTASSTRASPPTSAARSSG